MRPIQSQVWDHWGAMVLAARPVVGSLEEARDCASEAVLQYLERRPQDVVHLEAFMVTIAKRRAIDHVRARERARIRDSRAAGTESLTTPDVAEDVATRAEALWADSEARRLLQPHVYRLLQLVADGVPLSEVACRLHMSERAAQSHLLRARRVVRAALARTLAALGIGCAALRRWSGSAAASTVALAAALAVVAARGASLGTSAPVPEFVLLPSTTVATLNSGSVAVRTSSASHTGWRVARSVGPISGAARKPSTVLSVRTPLGGVRVEQRDDGHHSDGPVQQVEWCLEHLRVELHYQGCDSQSGQQGAGDLTGDRPLLPTLG